MKNIFLLLALVLTLSSCGLFKNSNRQKFKITVIDKKNDQPIESTQVSLVTMIDARDVFREVQYTDKNGVCRFKTSYPERAQFQVYSKKAGYQSYLSITDENILNGYVYITEKTGRDIVVYLTSDPLNRKRFYEAKVPRYEIDSLVEILRTNQFPPQRSIPQLRWEDIPKLLSIGNDPKIIDRYPVNPISSISSIDCHLGIVALWFIETIRLTEQANTDMPRVTYPSQFPLLLYLGAGFNKDSDNNKKIMELAYLAYSNWWKKVENMDKNQACKIDPLDASKVNW